jgi:hypothetical protein
MRHGRYLFRQDARDRATEVEIQYVKFSSVYPNVYPGAFLLSRSTRQIFNKSLQRRRKRNPAPKFVRFTPQSGHVRCNLACPLWANSGHRHPRAPRGKLSKAVNFEQKILFSFGSVPRLESSSQPGRLCPRRNRCLREVPLFRSPTKFRMSSRRCMALDD